MLKYKKIQKNCKKLKNKHCKLLEKFLYLNLEKKA